MVMGTVEPKDPFKGVDWKAIGSELQKDPSAASKPVIKKRLPKKIRQIPECYFLPRRSLPSSIAFYGAWIAGGIGAGMLLEVWINKKVKGIAWLAFPDFIWSIVVLDSHYLSCLLRTLKLEPKKQRRL